ncbi:MAG: GntR family transcriptional regulator [Hyphomicrobiaceae bacterium]|nr:GntR family transcriptional regulator [Hyphomicrobiaceae bacterium]
MRAAVSPDTRLPIYLQLKDAFAAKIQQGVWSHRDPVPSENKLAEAHKVAVGTVRKAMEGLVAEGLLERRQGKGTFVRRPDFGSALFRFFRLAGADGEVLRPTARILKRRIVPADQVSARALAVAPGTPLICLFRARCVDGRPILVEDIAIEASRFAPLAELPTDQFGDLLYPLYDEVCGELVVRATETIRFDAASPRVAKALELTAGTALAVIERVAYGPDGRPLERRRSYGPADRFSYTIELR